VFGRGDVRIGLQFFLAMGRDPRTQKWFSHASPLTGTGAASARAFVDTNMNGVLDDGEETISGAAFVVNSSGRHPNRTGKDGTARLDQLAAGRYVDVALDPNSLDDPQWKPVRAGLRLLPRSGVIDVLEFPVVPTSDIEGTVCRTRAGRCVGVPSALVELVDDRQNVVDKVRTGSDGYYWFRQIMPGEYRLRLSAQSVGLTEASPGLSRVVQVLKRGDFIAGADFRLEDRAAH
jgi:Carboxypeptidase regulatory-like domain